MMADPDNCRPMGGSATGPVLGATEAGLRFQLARGDGDAATPFVVLHHGRYSRIYLAHLAVPGGSPVLSFAWKIQTDLYKRGAAGGQQLANPEVDDLWRREIEDLQRVESPQVVRRVDVPGGLAASPPISYCTRTDRYFHPVCGSTGEVLGVCRDDDFLAECGLVKYSQDSWRYLYGGGRERQSRRFYRVPGANGERPRSGVEVRLGVELYRDFGALVAAPDSPAAQRAASALPCLSCSHRAECFAAEASGKVPAEDYLHPVSYYDFQALPLQLFDLDYDQLMDLLGGAAWKEVVAGSGAAQQQRLAGLASAFDHGTQWLFEQDPSRLPCEVLDIKLAAYEDVVRGLSALHQATGRPHFGLAPQNVMARFVPGGPTMPSRWGFQVQLVDLGGPVRMRLPGSAGNAPTLLQPGSELRDDLRMRPYFAPDLQAADGQSVAMALRFQSSTAENGRIRLVGEATGGVNLKRYQPGDWLCVSASSGLSTADTVLWLRLDEIKARGCLASAEIEATHPAARWAGRSVDATCNIYRVFGPPVDLYGLGMLLFRTLLVNDQQSMDEVEEVVGKMLRRLRDEVPASGGDEAAVVARIRQFLGGKDVRARFEARNILQQRELRAEYQRTISADREPIDQGAWAALLTIAFKLCTQIPGFSYAHSHAEGSPFLLRQVLGEIKSIRQRNEVDLHAAGMRDAAIHQACVAVAEELRKELLAAPDARQATAMGIRLARATNGCRITVERDGDPAPQDLEFTKEQITIGRREIESLIRLNDSMVSSAHAVIERTPDGWVVVDRNSTNGTEVDGIRLPGEVSQPLQDGSRIRIRPFTLTFHTGTDPLNATAMVKLLDGDEVVNQLLAEFAACRKEGAAAVAEALRQVLLRARGSVGVTAVLAMIDEIRRRFRAGSAKQGDDTGPVGADFFASAHKALERLAKDLLGSSKFEQVTEVDLFVRKLGGFVTAASEWMERASLLRRELGTNLELSVDSSGFGGVRATAEELRARLLDFRANAESPEQAAQWLGKFCREAQGLAEGLLAASKVIRKAVRDRLDPNKLLDQVGGGWKNNMAASSALWKHYVGVFQDITENKLFELELDRLLQKCLQDHRPK